MDPLELYVHWNAAPHHQQKFSWHSVAVVGSEGQSLRMLRRAELNAVLSSTSRMASVSSRWKNEQTESADSMHSIPEI